MKNHLFLSCVLALTGLTGCTSLSVAVDVLDPSYAHRGVADAALVTLFTELQASGSPAASEPIVKLVKQENDAVKRIGLAYDTYASKLPTAERKILEAIASPFKNGIPPTETLTSEIRQMNVNGAEALRLARAAQWSGVQPIPAGVKTALTHIVEQRAVVAQIVSAEIEVFQAEAAKLLGQINAAAPSGDLKRAVDQLAVAASYARTIIAGPTLASSEYAYIVANADDQYWSRSFNRAYGNGTFGSSDIVIKMNSQADFSVKGMRFDATTVAAVASKVMTQALLIGVQMAGVPVRPTSGAAPTGDGAALAGTSGDLASSEELVVKRASKFFGWRQAMRDMASTLLAEDGSLTASTSDSWTTDREAISSAIDGTRDALRPILSLDGLN